jgi:feruloyl esterase
MAQTVPAGAFAIPSGTFMSPQYVTLMKRAAQTLPAFCRVAASLKPTVDSDIKIEVWMPISGWNGNFLGVGNGGWAGWISYPLLAEGLRDGFSAASTDTGHAGDGGDASFVIGHPEKLVDSMYRSEHEMTVVAKAIIAAFYGQPSRFAYWNGCSKGGQQGLVESQRFPDDYNGIVEGDPGTQVTHLIFATIWPPVLMHQNSASYIPTPKLALLNQTVLKACDALDGVTDGILNDPTRCHFDPKVLECEGPDNAGCLTAPQVAVVQKIYAGPKNPRTGEQIFPGLEPGSELGWPTGDPSGPASSFFRYVLFKNPDWNWRDLNFDSDVALADQLGGSLLNAADPNLGPFKAHGGKLLMYHGWSDASNTPLLSVNYYKSVVATMGGADKTEDFVRLFMIPGMFHCGGGPGPNSFNKLRVLEQWVENGSAPDKIIASHMTDGKVDMTRPLCPYPEVAQWKGSGDTNDAANFACVNETVRKDSAVLH